MADSLFITGGRVVDPAQALDAVTTVTVANGQITALGESAAAPGAETIDARGLIVAPGLIDMHVHLREPGGEAAETVATGTAAAAAGGFTAVACMPNTQPAIDTDAEVEYVLRQAQRAGATRVYVIGALTKGRAGAELAEMGLMARAGAVAFSDDGCGVADAALCRRALEYVAMLDKLFVQHCEDASLAGGGCMNAGPLATKLGLPGIPNIAEEVMIERDLALAAVTGARYHVAHISTARAVDLVRQAKQRGVRVTAEVTPHHLLLTDEACADYDTDFKMNPPLRTPADVEACRAGVQDGTIDCLVTDHAPHPPQAKQLEFQHAAFGIVGLETALGLYIQALVESGLLSWSELIAAMATTPARLLNVPGGSLAVGQPADITLIDPDRDWTVARETFVSKSQNTPFDGWRLRGRAVRTIVGGETTFALPAEAAATTHRG